VYSDYRSDPLAKPLPTPSGKLEIFSETIDSFGYSDCPGHPVWLEPAEWLGAEAAQQWPLHLMSNQPVHKLHSQLDFAGPSREAKVDGRETATLSPDDARQRGIETGDVIRLFNARGETLASAVISEDVRSGVVLLPTGAWFDPVDAIGERGREKHGNPNVLTLDKGTSRLGQGPIAHTTLVEVEKFTGSAPKVTAFELPDIVPSQS
ncbi:MAG: molybdopterin dinucleotide binding domain-containing protein, partial [Hyphomicrobiaceae bacterium]